MDKKGTINKDYIKSYSASYTNNILDTAFKEGPYLQGNDLKRLCNLEQINYNLLKAIFLQWEAEVNKLQNPYFDHSAPAVQNALKTYMEVLSRHIKLDKGSLRPLLQQAVEETLYQVFTPLYFFENFLWPPEIGSLTFDEITKLRRFVKINQAFLKELIGQWKKENKSEIKFSEYKSELRRLGAQWDQEWESTENYEATFSKVVALHVQTIWKQEREFEPDVDKGIPNNVNQRFARKVVSLNETLQKEQTTLADHLNKNAEHVDNIRKRLNINQKFKFINELYGGNSNEFNQVIDKIDRCKNYQEAIQALDDHSTLRSEWDMENLAVKELFDLVSKRFSEPGPAFGGRPFSTK